MSRLSKYRGAIAGSCAGCGRAFTPGESTVLSQHQAWHPICSFAFDSGTRDGKHDGMVGKDQGARASFIARHRGMDDSTAWPAYQRGYDEASVPEFERSRRIATAVTVRVAP